MTKSRGFCYLAVALFLTACSQSGGGSSSLPSQVSPSAKEAPVAKATVAFRFKIPHGPRRSHYVSPGTKSIQVSVFNATHAHRLTQVTHNTTPGTGGCSAVSGGTFTCSFTVGIPAGKSTFDVVAYDAAGAEGHQLSALTDYAFTAKQGKSNVMSIALDGIPASVTLTLIDPNVFETGSQTAGFQFAGLMAQTVQVAALDAAGYTIVAPGAATLGLQSNDATDLTISAVAGSSSQFALTPRSNAASITLSASATALSGGTPVTASATLALGSVLYVANYAGSGATASGSVMAFVPWAETASSLPVETIVTGIDVPGVLLVDGSGNLWVGNNADGHSGTGSITEYAPGSLSPSRTITGVTEPNTDGGESLAVDSSGNLYCACNGAVEVDEYTPVGGSVPSRTLTTGDSPAGIDGPYSVVVDAAGNLYVANYSSNTVGISVFAPGTSTTPTRNITNGINGVWLMAFDTSGNLYGANYSASPATITEYAPGSGTVLNTFGSTSGIDTVYGLAVDRSANVYAANYTSETGVEFTASSKATPARTFAGINGAYAVATDPAGQAYFPAESDSKVFVFPATGTTATQTLTAANGIDEPWYVATWP